jgi:peptidoglycan/xylan/chitin deacetylase (PgdA/CDA1 family)
MTNFNTHLNFFNKHFRNLNYNDLDAFFTTKDTTSRQGIIITFDDGLRSNYDFALPLLEKYNFTGWFCIPLSFISNPTIQFADNHKITYRQIYTDSRIAMNFQELIQISKKHVIICHTNSHHRMNPFDKNSILKYEIEDSKLDLEKTLNKKIEIFCWVGGELQHYTKEAYMFIKNAKYKYSFTTNNKLINYFSNKHSLDRTNIESNMPFHLFLFQLSGIMDLYYTKKRFIINKIFRINDFN